MPAIKITPQRIEGYARVLQTASEQRLISDEGFEQLHAGFVVRTAEGEPWTVGLKTGKWNHVVEGRWVHGEAPAELYVESEVLFELERLKHELERTTPPDGPRENPRRDEMPAPTPRIEASAQGEARAHAETATSPSPQPSSAREQAASEPNVDTAPLSSDTQTSPRRAPERIVERPRTTEWSPAVLCLVLGVALAAIGFAKSSGMAYGAAGLFALLVVSIVILNSQSR